MAKKTENTNIRTLSAALLKMDKRAFKHVETTGNVASEFLKIELVKGTASKNLAGYVQCVPSPDGEKSVLPYMAHVADLTQSEYIVFRMAFVMYGKGEIKHPVFNRDSFTEATTPFFVAVNKLDGNYIILRKADGEYQADTLFTAVYGDKANARLGIVRAKLTALMNALQHGASKDFIYDERESVTRDQKGRTAYGQFLDDNGKPDADLKTWKQAQVTAVYGDATKGTDPAEVS